MHYKIFIKEFFFQLLVFSCFYFLAIFRIADVMMFNISDIDTKLVQVNLDRGKIFDRNGELLSSNITTQSLFVNSKYIKKKREISQKISSIINIDSKTIYEKLNSNKKFVYLKRHISPIEQKKIIDLGEINLRTHSEIKRIYPFQNVASHIVGHVNIDNIGKSGVELGFDQALSNGKNIYLTIDINLQNAVRNELIKTISKFSAESGTVIIMDIKNSEILSLTNYPDFDANNIGKSSLNERLNRALQSNYEMGSTFKPLTIAMGVEYNLIDRHMSFDVSKPIKNTINDWDPCDCSLNIKDIIVKSSNIGTAKIAKKIGKDNQIKFLKKLVF